MKQRYTELSNQIKVVAAQINRVSVSGSFTQHIASTLTVQVVSLVVLMGNGAIIARWLGVEGKGIQQLAFLLPAMLGLFLNGGIGVANVYFAGSRQLDVQTLTANAIGFTLIVAPVGLGVVWMGYSFGWLEILLPGIPGWALLITLITFPVEMLTGFFLTILQGKQLINTVNLINVGRHISMLALTSILVIGLELQLLGAILAPIGAGLITFFVSAYFLSRRGGRFLPKWDAHILRTTLAFGLKGHLGNILQFFNYRLDVFIVNFFVGPAGVGIYGVSARLAELLWQLPHAVSFVIFPKAASTDAAVMNKLTPRIFKLTLLITLFGAVTLSIIGKYVIQFIYSDEFLAAYGPMLALLPGVVLLGGAKVLANEIAGRGFPIYNSINSGVSLVITVGLDLSLIPFLGVMGAAIASSVAYTLTFGLTIWFYLKVSKQTIAVPETIVR